MKRDNFEIAQITATLSFVIGTTLFALFLYLDQPNYLIGFGLAFIMIATLLNGIMFLFVLSQALAKKTARAEGIKTCLLQLANIPIAILYFYLLIM